MSSTNMRGAECSGHRVAALILAAGSSSRMGNSNKLLADWRGKALVRHVVEQAVNSLADPVCVVTGHQSGRVASVLEGMPVMLVHNPDYSTGLAGSLCAGVRALPPWTGGVLVCLADMPLVGCDVMNRLIAAYAPEQGREICVPTHRGQRGNPVLFGRRFFPELLRTTGDKGARRLLDNHGDLLARVVVESPGVLLDVDTPEALARLTVE